MDECTAPLGASRIHHRCCVPPEQPAHLPGERGDSEGALRQGGPRLQRALSEQAGCPRPVPPVALPRGQRPHRRRRSLGTVLA